MVDTKDKFSGLFGGGFDDAFSDEGDILLIDVDDLIPFKQHLFSPYDEETMDDLVRSIDDMGQLSPCLVREHPEQEGKYEILSGHNRAEACQRLNQQVKVIVFPDELTDDQAKLIVIESNIKQRTLQALAPSEQAKIIAEHHRLIRKQGKRTDLAKLIDDLDENEKTEESSPYNLSKRQINNYVRIDEYLCEPLKILMDDGKLPVKAASELSFIIDEESQEAVADFVKDGGKISEGKAKQLRKKAEDETLSTNQVKKIVLEKKTSPKLKVVIPDEMISSIFFNMCKEEILELIENAVAAYQED
ncbi:ParB/RepB/Spo0J family partition protein [Acetobacterium wieringae]|uniref:ParB/RepB/Spo0J family partition protein n=1 Tax=Acetobacterium wieringae TaxID=52694 RepID=A0ABY6HJF1_9FIRM|nr:ParB/RepB/Spo0J family partition protein [Acetobacterium wieringae]UYO64671.1 ParB/RepB/Spo0J family partition protein [Acetobacterium wieringae]